MKLFDSHCHLEDERFSEDLKETLTRMKEGEVARCILAGSNPEDCRKILSLVQSYPETMYAVVGYHPHDAKEWNDDSEAMLRQWLEYRNVIGIGEIGLDYYYDLSPKETQKEVFDKQLDLAYKLHKPAVLHIRDAHGDAVQIMRNRKEKLPRCVLHCFSGSPEIAREYLRMGFYLSFAGPLTFKNAAKLPEVAALCPKDRFFIETDSPYLAPVPMRGKRNEPTYVRYVAEKLGEIWNMELDEVARAAWNNTRVFYGLEDSYEDTQSKPE